MKTLQKLDLESFKKKYQNRSHISCGIHFSDGSFVSVQNSFYSYIEYVIKDSDKELAYIAVF